MSSSASNRDFTVADIEGSFGSRLVLTPREHVGVVIGSFDVSDSFVGFNYSLVAKGVSGFCMTIAVAKAIEATLGGVLWVDKRDDLNVSALGISSMDVPRILAVPMISSHTGPLVTTQALMDPRGHDRPKKGGRPAMLL
ncbi:unnamed protein product [Prunus brigantina]